MYIDLSNDDVYEEEYEKLVRTIYEQPLYKEPLLGEKPAWLENDQVPYFNLNTIIKQLHNASNERKQNIILKDYQNNFIEVMLQFKLTSRPDDILSEIINKIDQLKPLRDCYLNFLEQAIKNDINLIDYLPEFFENLYNNIYSLPKQDGNFCIIQYDHFKFLIWEMFIYTIGLLYVNNLNKFLISLINHTYFVCSEKSSEPQPNYFDIFNPDFNELNQALNKNSAQRLFSPISEKLIQRERKPLFTKQYIVSIDILLSQLYAIYFPENMEISCWFPKTYIYLGRCRKIDFWIRLVSNKECVKVMEIYKAGTIEELRENVQKYDISKNFHYHEDFAWSPSVVSVIDPNKIGSLP